MARQPIPKPWFIFKDSKTSIRPETWIEVPMREFKELVDGAPRKLRPEWTKRALDSQSASVVMMAKRIWILQGKMKPESMEKRSRLWDNLKAAGWIFLAIAVLVGLLDRMRFMVGCG